MKFNYIDLDEWDRKEYFNQYFSNVPCSFSITVKIDITNLKNKKYKIYAGLLYALTTVVNNHDEFRTALDENKKIGIFSEMLPCYTIFDENTKKFSTIWTKYSTNFTEFLKNYEEDFKLYGKKRKICPKDNMPLNVFNVSMIPWVCFDGFNLNLKKGYEYLLPIFTFGKYYQNDEKYYIPLSIQVHHAVCDGFHVSNFINDLQNLLFNL